MDGAGTARRGDIPPESLAPFALTYRHRQHARWTRNRKGLSRIHTVYYGLLLNWGDCTVWY